MHKTDNKTRHEKHSQKLKERKLHNRNLKLQKKSSVKVWDRRYDTILKNLEISYNQLPWYKKLWIRITHWLKI